MRPASVSVTLLLCILPGPAFANVEKTVFLAPATIHVPTDHPNLDDLQIDAFSPLQSSLRLHLDAAFPSAERSKGVESWYLLDNLNQGQRYEVRICWSATVSQTKRRAAYARPPRSCMRSCTLVQRVLVMLSVRCYSSNYFMAATDQFLVVYTHTVNSLRNTCPHLRSRFILGTKANR